MLITALKAPLIPTIVVPINPHIPLTLWATLESPHFYISPAFPRLMRQFVPQTLDIKAQGTTLGIVPVHQLQT
jgi:hypothetical protein